jgi:hypothetical protein
MKKKNIAFILWGVAASNFISIPVTLVLMPRLYERMGMPTTAARIGITTLVVVGLIVIIGLFCAGLIVYLKFRNE